MIKGYTTESGVSFVKLKRGFYSLSGEIVQNESYSVQDYRVNSFDEIREITKNSVITHYSDGVNILCVDEYVTKKHELSKSADEEMCFDSLDEEYEYRKFIQNWTPIKKIIETISEPLTVIVECITIDTGNPYIKSEFANGKNSMDIFFYNRKAAFLGIVRDKFNELGFEYQNKIAYEQTKGKKVWGNSTHSCVRYVTAFGKYPIKSGDPNNSRGTLEQMISMYNSDKKNLCGILQDEYNSHFNNFNDKNINGKELLDTLKAALNMIISLDEKKKDVSNKRIIRQKMNRAIENVNKCFEL